MKRDYFGYFLAVISIVIGSYVSYYYYEKSLQHRRPIFSGDYLPSTVYDVKQEARVPLKVTREDGQALQKSVHVATHTFWNAGNLPIAATDVLSPIRVSITAPQAEILSVSVATQSRSVVGCAIKQESATSFVVSFRILEQDDGCQIKVFYAGPQSPKYSVSGEVVGVKVISASGDTVYDHFEKQKGRWEWPDRLLSALSRSLPWFAASVFALLYMRSKPTPSIRRLVTPGAIVVLAGASLLIDHIQASRYVIERPPTVNTTKWLTPSAP